jgi:predicted RNA-binding Zn-ribbon protein involved in translation (DUF1610 family)
MINEEHTPCEANEKEMSVKRRVLLKNVKQNKKVTGKSKEYINRLTHSYKHRCRKCGKENISNVAKRQKLSNIIKREPRIIEEKQLETTEIGHEKVITDFEVVLLNES